MVEVPFIGPSYTLDALDVSAQSCVNMYVEIYRDGNTKVPASLRSTAGLSLFATQVGDWNMRCLYLSSDGTFFGVRGDQVSTFSTAGVEADRFDLDTGSISTEQGIVRAADSLNSAETTTNVLFVDGTANAYSYDVTTFTATKVTDSAFPGGAFVAQIGGYFIVNKPGTLKAYFSTINDPTTWNTLSTITKESTTDHITALIAHDGRLWMFGTQSHEVAGPTGDSNNPFLKIQGTESDIGIESPDSLAGDGDSLYWLGSDSQGFGKIYQSLGFDSQPISTVPIEREIHTYSVTNDAEGFCYQQDGHNYYQLTFPTENKTWCYDSTTRMWHEKSYWNKSTSTAERHRARVSAFFNGKNYIGDWKSTGQIYSFEQDVYTDNGDIIKRRRTGPTHWNNLNRLFYSKVEFDLEGGVGLTSGQGSIPKARFSYSNDGGNNYGNVRLISLGRIGDYKKRTKKERLGRSRKRVWKIEYTEPTKFTILSMFADIGQGSS